MEAVELAAESEDAGVEDADGAAPMRSKRSFSAVDRRGILTPANSPLMSKRVGCRIRKVEWEVERREREERRVRVCIVQVSAENVAGEVKVERRG